MTKAQALFSFWSGFNLPAYDETTVPEDAPFPRLTFEAAEDSFGREIALTASVWDYSTSWNVVEQKAAEIGQRITMGGITVPYDGGVMWLKRGTPFAQRMADDNDSVRRIVINASAEFISQD